MLAALLLTVVSFHSLFAGTVVGFLVSAAMVGTVVLPLAARGPKRSIYERTTKGMRIFLRTPRLRGLLALNLTIAAASAMVIVNTVVYVRDRLGGSESDTALVLAAVLAAVLSLVFIPADFEIEAKGTLQPRNRRDIFAPRDGSVVQLLTTEEKTVKANEPLLILRDPQLELEFKRVWGDMQTAQKRLAAVQAKRITAEFGDARSRAESKQWSAEEAEIKEMLKSLNAQYEILQEQQAELTVRSPIAGRVLTWDIEKLLESRPVQTGQILMTVADPSGPWELLLHVPDDDIGHVIDAQQANGGPLKLTFILATSPNITHEESVEQIAMSTELDDEKRPSVLVTAGIKQSQLLRKRPGATVIARIHCGRRSLGYVWLRELIEAVQTHVLF